MRCYRSFAQKPAEQSSNLSNYAADARESRQAFLWTRSYVRQFGMIRLFTRVAKAGPIAILWRNRPLSRRVSSRAAGSKPANMASRNLDRIFLLARDHAFRSPSSAYWYLRQLLCFLSNDPTRQHKRLNCSTRVAMTNCLVGWPRAADPQNYRTQDGVRLA